MIIVQVCILVTGNPELFLYPRPWLMSALVIRLSHPHAPHFSPLHVYPNLSISRELFWNPTAVVCCKLQCCHACTYNEKQDLQAWQLVLITDFRPSILLCSQNNYFLITYQTCHHYHGDNDANHNYYSYKQAGPVPRAMKVNMIMCVIMVITYCFISILYHGFVHGCRSWTAKQANHSKPQSLYTLAIPQAPIILRLTLFHVMPHDKSHLMPCDLDPSGSL